MNARKKDWKRKQRRKLGKTIRVLVVDDDQEIRDILRERLFIEGFEVSTADSGEEALAKFIVRQGTTDAFDVVTLDIRMRDLSGRQVLSLLRKIDQRVCILMISGLDDLSQAVQSLGQGADDYLSKPIKVWDIRDRMITALGRRASLVERESRRMGTSLAGIDRAERDSGIEAEQFLQEPTGQASSDDNTGTKSGLGVEWGTAISPSLHIERLQEDPRSASDRDPNRDSNRSDSDRSRDSDRSIDSISEPASPLRGLAGPGKPASEGSELIPPRIDKGRENDPGDRNDEHGTGENRAHDPRTGDRGESSVDDPEADQQASARWSGPMEGGRPGSPPGMGQGRTPAVGRTPAIGKTPLDRILELARRVESSWEGCENHGEEVAKLLEKLGATVATSLDLTSQDLDGLCLAARLHSLGIHEPQDEYSREWVLENAAQEVAHPLPGRDREDAGLVARILCALLEEESKREVSPSDSPPGANPETAIVNISLALLGKQGEQQHEERQLDPGLRKLLHSHLKDVASEEADPNAATGTQATSGVQIDTLLALYEVADGWIHLTHEGMGGLSPDEAFPELCAALTSQLPAHPTSMALAYLRTQI